MKLGGSLPAAAEQIPQPRWSKPARVLPPHCAQNRRSLPSQIAQKRRNPGALALGTPGVRAGLRREEEIFFVSGFVFSLTAKKSSPMLEIASNSRLRARKQVATAEIVKSLSRPTGRATYPSQVAQGSAMGDLERLQLAGKWPAMLKTQLRSLTGRFCPFIVHSFRTLDFSC